MISRPASSGSSLSIRCSAASPPPNSSVNSRLKWSLTVSNEVRQPLARFAVEALDALAQPLDGFDQVVALGGQRGVLGLDLAQLFLGAQIDGAEPLAVAAQLFEVLLDLGERRQLRARLDLGEAGDAPAARLRACRGFRARYRRAGAWCLPCALRRGRWLRGRADSASSEILAARSVSAIAVSAAASASAATRRSFSACSISLISALRFSANSAGALSSSARSAVTSVTRASMVAICEAALCLAVLPFGALGEDRLHAAVGEFGLARQRLRLGAHLRGEAAMALDVGCEPRRAASRCRGSAAIRRAPRLAFSCAASASARSAARRLCASVSADLRAAWRLISRSVAAWRSRAASASRCAARQASRAADSAAAAAFSSASAVSSACRLAAASMRACSSSCSISTSRARSARRRAAPVGAWAAATKPSQRQTSPSSDTSRWPVFNCDTSSAPRSFATTPICARRRASSGGACDMGRRAHSTPSGNAGSPSVGAGIGPAHRRRRIDRRVEIVAERGADRLLIALGDGDAVDDRRPQILGLAVDELGDRARFGLEPLHALVGFRQRRAGGFQRLARAATWPASLACAAASDCARLCCAVSIAAASAARSPRPPVSCASFCSSACDVGDFLVEPRQPVAMGADVGFELVALGGEVGELRGQFGEQALGRRPASLRLRRRARRRRCAFRRAT